jgi:thioesterase domain-containing protein
MISLPRSHDAWGWDQFSEEPVEIHTVLGSHRTMMTEPYVRVLAERLKAYLNEFAM